MDQAAGREPLLQAPGESLGPGPFFGAVRRRGPLLRLHVIGGHEGRLPAEGEADVAGDQFLVDGMAQSVDAPPLLLRVGQGDPGRAGQAVDGVGVLEGDLARARGP